MQPDPDTAYDDLRDQRDDEDMLALEKMGIPRDAERFNTQGADGRNCPVCLGRVQARLGRATVMQPAADLQAVPLPASC
jgi:hypothetical protein